MKRITWILIATFLFASFGFVLNATTPVNAAQSIKVVVNDVNLTMPVAPVSEKGRVLVPLAAIMDALKVKYSWDAKTQTITATKGDTALKLTIGKKAAYKNGKALNLDVPSKIIKSRTMVPVRFVGEAFKCQVTYIAASQTVVVDQFAGLSGSLKISGSTSVQPLAQELIDTFTKKNPKVQITLTGGGSGVGIKDATDGKVNIGNSSRYLKPEEKAALVPYVIANDAVVVVVSPQNPVSALTTEQVRKIFMGEIVNWKDLGGADAPIILNARDAASGTGSYFAEHFLPADGKVAATAKTHASNGLVRQAVSSNKNAIGYISLGYLNSTVKAPTLDGISANFANAKAGTYKVVRPFIMATKGDATGLAKSFIDYILSPAGQKIVAKEYLPVETD